MYQVEKARTLLGEAANLKRAGNRDAAFAKLWSAVDWLCDALEEQERKGSGTHEKAETRSVAPGAR
jgi:hypothetical protein